MSTNCAWGSVRGRRREHIHDICCHQNLFVNVLLTSKKVCIKEKIMHTGMYQKIGKYLFFGIKNVSYYGRNEKVK